MLFKMNRFFSLIVLLSLFLLGNCTPSLIKPDLSLQEIELTGVSFSSMDLAFIVKVKNPNPVGVNIEKLSYQLDLNDISLGSGELPAPISLKASGTEMVTLPFSTSFNGISNLVKMILGENELRYQLRGKAVLSKFWKKEEFPFDSKGVVPLNRSTFHH
jgi:LEA14-like dessication related protein